MWADKSRGTRRTQSSSFHDILEQVTAVDILQDEPVRAGQSAWNGPFGSPTRAPGCRLTKFVDRPQSSRNIERRTAEQE